MPFLRCGRQWARSIRISPVFNIMTLDAATSISLLPVKVAATLTAALGVLSTHPRRDRPLRRDVMPVRQRAREIGIRMALGANSGAVVRLIAGQGLHWTAIGLALGLGAAFGVARLIAGFLCRHQPDRSDGVRGDYAVAGLRRP